MKLVDITVRQVLPDPPDLAELTDEQRAAVSAWFERCAAECMLQAMGHDGPTRMYVDAQGQIQIELIDPMALQAGADQAAAAAGPESCEGRAGPAPLFPHWPLAYCGN